jgi:putative SOS response-associated peptidase YedK
MCGRFTQFYSWRELVELYRLSGTPLDLEPRYNIAPTTKSRRCIVPMSGFFEWRTEGKVKRPSM